MSLEYKYSLRDFADKETLRAFIDDDMNRPDSLDELISVMLQADGTFIAVLRSKKQARPAERERFERNNPNQKEHERFQGGSNFNEQGRRGPPRPNNNGPRDNAGRQDTRGPRAPRDNFGRQDTRSRFFYEGKAGLPVDKDEPGTNGGEQGA